MSSLSLLTKEEDTVLDIIQEFVDHNRIFNYQKIIPYIRNRFSRTSININETGIKTIIETLIKKKIIIQGSKLTKAIILQNPNRRKIYDFIKQNPGLYFYRVTKNLNLPNHVITWHMDVLIKFGFIKSSIIDNHEVFFHPKVDPSEYMALYTLSKRKCRLILAFISENINGKTKTSVSRNLDIHYNTVSKYINLMEQAGLLFKEKKSNKTLYKIHQAYLTLLDRL